jgi:hypothetical protein
MDTSIPLQYRGAQIEPPTNALARIMQLQGMMQQNALGRLQMQELERRNAEGERVRNALAEFQQSIPSPQMGSAQNALAGGGGPTVANAQRMQPVDPRLQYLHGAMRSGLVSPLDYLNAAHPQPKPDDYKVVGDALVRVGPTGVAPVYKSDPKPEKLPSAVQEYEYAKAQGYKGTFEQWDRESKKAGATSVTVNAEKPFLNSLGDNLGKQLDTGLSNAKAAAQTIQTAHRLRQAVDSGKIVAGPTASWRVFGLQLGQMLGIGGKDAAETLANTRTAMQSMAQAELDAAQQMKGQGQITEAERDIIRRAASGSIDALTAPEVSLLAQALEKTARGKLASHKTNVDNLRKMPAAAPLVPFYELSEPPAYAPPASAADGWSIRPKPGGK